MKLEPSYYASQLNRLGFQTTEDLLQEREFSPSIVIHFGGNKTNHMDIDARCLYEIYEALVRMEKRGKA